MNNLENVLTELLKANLRNEILMTVVIDTLASKKQADGSPLVTREEIMQAAEKFQEELKKEASKASIILPNKNPFAP